MGRVNFDTDSYAYQQDQRKLSRYRNPYKHPDTLAVADAHFDGATSYTEQFIPTRVRNELRMSVSFRMLNKNVLLSLTYAVCEVNSC